MDRQKSKPQIMVGDVKSRLTEVAEFITTIESLNRQYREALAFAEKQIKSGKAWDEECENVIGEALRPKPPKGFTGGPEIPLR
jgi:hypothetical protein